jgi:hypothetical protein
MRKHGQMGQQLTELLPEATFATIVPHLLQVFKPFCGKISCRPCKMTRRFFFGPGSSDLATITYQFRYKHVKER